MERSNRLRGFWNRYCKRGYRFICFLLCFKDVLKVWRRVFIAQPGERILDGGCGSGGMFQLLKEAVRPRMIVAVDFSEEMLEEAKKEATRLNRRNKSLIYRIIRWFRRVNRGSAISTDEVTFEFKKVDLTQPFPWTDNHFGGEVFSLVLCYMLPSERKHVLAESYRTIKPGGYVYTSNCLEGWDFSKEVRKRMPKEFLLGPITSIRALPVVPCTKEMDRLKKEGMFSYPEEGEVASLLKEIGFTEIYTAKSFGGGVEIVRAQKPLS